MSDQTPAERASAQSVVGVHDDRPAILDRLRAPRGGTRPHAVLEASAGTGKTHTLEHLVIDLLLEGARIEEILVVTFTEKATLEMRARIRKRIAALVADGHEALRDALLGFDRAPISTIHAFCQRILTEHAFRGGRLLEEERLDGRLAFARAFRGALRCGLADDATHRALLMAALREQSASALESTLYAWSRETGEVRPRWDTEAISAALRALPTPAQVDGTEGRAALAYAPSAARPRARRALRALCELAASQDDVHARAKLVPELLAWAKSRPSGDQAETDAALLAGALSAHPQLATPLRTLHAALDTTLVPLVATFLPTIVMKLEQEKRRLGRRDFDDMLSLVHEALSSSEGDALADALRARYRFALVDEFQDTDPIQWAIFRKVFFEPRSGGEDNPCRLYLIGDPKQSIYAFRSADVHTYREAVDALREGGGVEAPLVYCWRSTPKLIAAINRILERDFFTGPNRYDHPVQAARPELRALGHEDVELSPVVLLHLHARGSELRSRSLRATHANAIATEITHLLEGGMRVGEGEATRPIRHGDVFILTRTAREGYDVGDALRARGIPHAFFKVDGLFATREASDVLDVLRAVLDPADRRRRLRALLTPFFGVALEDLSAYRDPPSHHPYLARLLGWAALARESRIAPLFASMVDESGLARRLLYARESERELTNYQHVLEVLLAHASRGHLGLDEVASHLAALVEGRADSLAGEEDVQRLESEREAVQILTMHKSKGLEAEVVFLYGGMGRRVSGPHEPRVYHEHGQRVAWMGAPPDEVEERVAAEAREEDERLFYVAMTRARSRLYLPYVGAPPPSAAVIPDAVYEYAYLGGSYRVLNERLAALVASGKTDDEGPVPLITRRSVELRPARRRSLSTRKPARDAGPKQPIAAPPSSVPDALYEALRASAAGFVVTSYTRMKAARARRGEEAPVLDEARTLVEEAAAEAPAPAAEEEALPGGAATGLVVHEALEHVDWSTVAQSEDGRALLEAQGVRAIFERTAQANGVDPVHLPAAADLVLRALRTPLRALDLALDEGLVQIPAEDRLAEMTFLHPIPEGAQPALGGHPGPRAHVVERGFIRGVIDLVFSRPTPGGGERVYVIDWKTDRLARWTAGALSEHVAAHYEVQARLYALGVARLLGIEDETQYEARFGGLLYLFVRGMQVDERGRSRGVHAIRPSWTELLSWDRELREQEAPWGHPLPARVERELDPELLDLAGRSTAEAAR